ncbi:glycosyltransferase [Oceanobacillus sp. Castelsardo]|uniref:glycosyltransferase family protein n=1 Tax=Oceanobacillus sp. Castelsardo TaxID=1851204 RepID=UPI000839A456|nr:glycosyltransferase [Oceanobacillus sp. Castelsardo]
MEKRLKILVLIKQFGIYVKHQPKMEMIKEIEKYADIYYWHKDGHIKDIIRQIGITPDFIFHYDIAWNYGLAPNVQGLNEVDIKKGCFVIDLHWKPEERIRYFENVGIDIIFSPTKHPFYKVFPQYKDKHSWLPWSINPAIMKDWKLKKSIDYLLMGLVYTEPNKKNLFSLPKQIPPKGRYEFRDKVLEKMINEPGFVFHPHPGHRVRQSDSLLVNEKYAKELNRSKIFFTCGSRSDIGGVAVLKFFEAPACKTLLLAEPNEDIKDLGFIDGKNYVAANVENVVEKSKYYLDHEELRTKITENGYKLIHNHHTNKHRAIEFISEVKKLF